MRSGTGQAGAFTGGVTTRRLAAFDRPVFAQSVTDSKGAASAPLGPMIRITVNQAAFDAIASTLPLGSVAYEQEPDANGERQIWLAAAVVARLTALRGPGESYSDVILRLAKVSLLSGQGG
jgi:hypothetical protein